MGMATEWGKLMATISEDNDEETPLQVGNYVGMKLFEHDIGSGSWLLFLFFATSQHPLMKLGNIHQNNLHWISLADTLEQSRYDNWQNWPCCRSPCFCHPTLPVGVQFLP